MFKNNIQSQFLRNFYLLIIIPIALLGVTTYYISSTAIQDKVIQSKLNSLEQLNKNIDTEVQKINKYFDLIFTSPKVHELLRNTDFTSFDSAHYQSHQEMTSLFSSFFNNDTKLVSAGVIKYPDKVVYTYKGELSFSDTDDIKDAPWLKDTEKENGAIHLIGSTENYDPFSSVPWVFSAARLLKDISYKKDLSNLGIVYMSFDESVFADTFQQVETRQSGSIMILDHRGRVISSPVKEDLGKDMHERSYIADVYQGKNGWFRTNLEDKDVMIIYYTSALTGWKVVEITPYTYLTSDVKKIGMVTLVLGVACLIILYLVSYVMAVRISTPIKQIRNSMREVSQGNFDVSIRLATHTSDEIGQIATSFNFMVRQLSLLFETTKSQERRNREIEIKMLQYQINPHFLYNTLSSISLIARMKDYDSISITTQALSRLLRNVLGKAGNMIPLSTELDNVQDFVQIMNIRYDNCIRLNLNVPSELLHCAVPNLLLQPLVENSIFHGLDSQNSNFAIAISAGLKNDTLIITVEDNGVGMAPEKIQQIKSGRSSSGKHNLSNIGLYNIDERLKLNYGSEYGISILSSPGEGTTVTIELPATGGINDYV